MKIFTKITGMSRAKVQFSFFVFLFLALGSSFQAAAQRDLIVTQAGEEIRCRILDETPTRFVYAYVAKNDKVLRNEIFKNLVTSFKYNFYETDLVNNSKLPGDDKRVKASSKRVDTRKTKTPKKEKKKTNSKKVSKKADDIEEVELNPSKSIAAAPQEGGGSDVNQEKQVNEPLEREVASPKEPSKKELRKAKKQAKEIETTVNNEVKEEIQDVDSNVSAIASESSIVEEVEPLSKKEIKEQKKLDKKGKKELSKAKEENKVTEKEVVEIENKELLVEPEKESEFKNYLKFRVGVKGGISNIIKNSFESTNAYDLYREKLFKGWAFGADAAYFFTEGIGAGVMFTNFMTKNNAEGLSYPNLLSQTQVDNGSISTNISNKYIGPVLYLRKGIDFKTFVVLGLSPGMNFYNESGDYNGENYNFKAEQFGGAATLGLDFLLGNDIIGRDIILSLEAGYNYSRFDQINYGGTRGIETLTSPMVMDRLDFSIGIRFMRFPKYLKSN